MQLHNKVNKDELKELVYGQGKKRITLSFYKYAKIGNVRLFRDHFYILLDRAHVLGRIYVANEGVNGQISVPADKYEKFCALMNEITFLQGIRHNIAIEDDGKSFFKLTIKARPKIVADGLDDKSFDVTNGGTHINAAEFNEITDKENTVVIDMRNHYESEVGHFKNAITPDVETFRESLPIIDEMLEKHSEKNIVMYCTGGIRCEKASAYFKHQGYKNVYQLDGGIIEYARQVEESKLENKFIGKNFVFDDRLGERISEEVIAKCHQCGTACDTHTNCSNDGCHILFIQCPNCKAVYDDCCSIKCRDFKRLPEQDRQKLKATVEFNGSKFGKGRYKAVTKDEPLDLN